MRHILSRSTLFLGLIACLFILPACDSGGSNSGDDSGGGGGGGGGSSSTVGVESPSGPNAFEMSIASLSSSANALSKAVDKTYGGYAFQFSGTTPQGEDYYFLFFSSADPSTFTDDAANAELFGVLATEKYSDPPPTGTYTLGEASESSTDFYGLIGENFDSGDTGTRTVQALTNGEIVIDNSGDLTLTDFNSVSGPRVTVDLPVEDQNDFTTEDNVSVDLTGSVVPGTTNNFAETSFGYSVSF